MTEHPGFSKPGAAQAKGITVNARSIRSQWLWLLLAAPVSTVLAEAVFTSAAVEWDCFYEARRDYWDDMCMAWRIRMGELGYTKKRGNYSRLRLFRWADPSVASFGLDNDYADSAIAAQICTHGRYPNASQGWRGAMYKKEHGTCNLNKSRRKYGRESGGKLRFLQLSSCNSMPWPLRSTWDSDAEGGVHVVAGFHGTMSIGPEYVDQYRTMATKGKQTGVAEAWVETMYHPTGYAWRMYPNCPVARAYGDSEARANTVLEETYGDNLDDTEPRFAANLFIGGCDPHDDDEEGELYFQRPLPQ